MVSHGPLNKRKYPSLLLLARRIRALRGRHRKRGTVRRTTAVSDRDVEIADVASGSVDVFEGLTRMRQYASIPPPLISKRRHRLPIVDIRIQQNALVRNWVCGRGNTRLVEVSVSVLEVTQGVFLAIVRGMDVIVGLVFGDLGLRMTSCRAKILTGYVGDVIRGASAALVPPGSTVDRSYVATVAVAEFNLNRINALDASHLEPRVSGVWDGNVDSVNQ